VDLQQQHEATLEAVSRAAATAEARAAAAESATAELSAAEARAREALDDCRQELIACRSECARLVGQLSATDGAHLKLEGVVMELRAQLDASGAEVRRLHGELQALGAADAEARGREEVRGGIHLA
jgi:chromosome segregation ATPase